MTVMFTQMPREDVVSYLANAWPAPPGSTIERVAFLSEAAHGGVSVQSGSRPGTTWWVVDGVIVPQDAGPLPELEGDELITLPSEEPETPPITPTPTVSTLSADTP
ncbi:hypothetical protein ACF1AE_25645 [Streptomyces sp. NPDC014986]|uniref:hypothetical protein n=1 Tax=Streptomyces sp. NPDC014986 TaxID=3364934 RepID=UPI0036F59DAC